MKVRGVGETKEALRVAPERSSSNQKFLLCYCGVWAFAEKWNGGGWCPGKDGFDKPTVCEWLG